MFITPHQLLTAGGCGVLRAGEWQRIPGLFLLVSAWETTLNVGPRYVMTIRGVLVQKV